VEILILSKMLHVPIHVMQRAQEAGRYGTLVLTAIFKLRLHACLVAHIAVLRPSTLPQYALQCLHACFGTAEHMCTALNLTMCTCKLLRVCGMSCREEKGFVPIVRYGEEFEVVRKGRREKKPVKLLYSSGNHYDLLLPSLL